MIRVIRPIPEIANAAPPGCVVWGGNYDYLTEGGAPDDAIYVAEVQDGVVVTLVEPPEGFVFEHHFAGWEVA